MKIHEQNGTCIITPLSPILNKRECTRIFEILKNSVCPKFALDLSCVEDCTIDFLNSAKDFSNITRLSFFNISSDVFALINYLGLDKCIDLFVSEEDFIKNTHRIIRRRFEIV